MNEMLYDIDAVVYDAAKHSDGAYELMGEGLTADEVASRLKKMLSSEWGLSHGTPPHRLNINITPHVTSNLPS